MLNNFVFLRRINVHTENTKITFFELIAPFFEKTTLSGTWKAQKLKLEVREKRNDKLQPHLQSDGGYMWIFTTPIPSHDAAWGCYGCYWSCDNGVYHGDGAGYGRFRRRPQLGRFWLQWSINSHKSILTSMDFLGYECIIIGNREQNDKIFTESVLTCRILLP